MHTIALTLLAELWLVNCDFQGKEVRQMWGHGLNATRGGGSGETAIWSEGRNECTTRRNLKNLAFPVRRANQLCLQWE